MKYPKLVLLLCSFVVAYVLHSFGVFDRIEYVLNGHGYWSMLLAGILFSFGFTSAFGVAILVDLSLHVNPFLGAIAAGFGAMLTDIGIFSFVRFAVFHDEIHRLRHSRFIRFFHTLLHRSRVPSNVRSILLWSFAGLIIASPLPDEFGVALVSSVSNVRSRQFALLCFVLNTIGILVILLGAVELQS